MKEYLIKINSTQRIVCVRSERKGSDLEAAITARLGHSGWDFLAQVSETITV